MEVGESNAHCNCPTRTRLRPKSTGDPIDKMTQRGSKYFLCSRLPSERRLGSGRLRSAVSRDFPRVAVPGQRCKLLSNRTTDHPFERPSRHLGQLADGMDTHLGQARLGGRTHSPYQLAWHNVTEISLWLAFDQHLAARIRQSRDNLQKMLVAVHGNRDLKTNLVSHTAPFRACNLGRPTEKMGAARDIGE